MREKWDKYPDYKSGEIEEVYNSLSAKDKNSLNEFCDSCRTSASEHKVQDIRRCVLQLQHITNKEFSQIKLDDLRHFLVLLNQSKREAWTKHDIKAHVKRFLKYYFEDWSKRFNALKEMRNEAVGMNQEKINPQTLLSKQEIETIMNKENDIYLKTFFITLYETGMRPKELRTCKWADINFNVDGNLSEIHSFMTKTKKSKVVFVDKATFYLKKLQNQTSSDYVFPSRQNNKTPISDVTAHRWINGLGKHINKKIYPYLLRHTRAQELYSLVDENKLSERVVQRFLGHGKSMRDIYSQLSSKTLKDAVTKAVYQFEELPSEKRHELEKKIEALERNEKERVQQMKDVYKILDKLDLKKLMKSYANPKS